jgi:hypothetical protein
LRAREVSTCPRRSTRLPSPQTASTPEDPTSSSLVNPTPPWFGFTIHGYNPNRMVVTATTATSTPSLEDQHREDPWSELHNPLCRRPGTPRGSRGTGHTSAPPLKQERRRRARPRTGAATTIPAPSHTGSAAAPLVEARRSRANNPRAGPRRWRLVVTTSHIHGHHHAAKSKRECG